MPETIEHRIIRSKAINIDLVKNEPISEIDVEKINSQGKEQNAILLPEYFHIPGPAQCREYQPTILPNFLNELTPKVKCSRRKL